MPPANTVTHSTAAQGWHSAGYAVDRMSGEYGWLRCWLQIAAVSEALVIFGPTTPTMKVILEMCGRIRLTEQPSTAHHRESQTSPK